MSYVQIHIVMSDDGEAEILDSDSHFDIGRSVHHHTIQIN
jgi:hypothetical protein